MNPVDRGTVLALLGRSLIVRAFLRMLPALIFGIVFVGGVYTLLALDDHSWWKPLVYIVAVPLVAGFMNRAWGRLRPRSTDQASVDDAGPARFQRPTRSNPRSRLDAAEPIKVPAPRSREVALAHRRRHAGA